MNQRKTKKYMGYSGLLVILLIAIDQFTKWLAYTHLYQKPDVSVIDGVFQLKYLENDSGRWNIYICCICVWSCGTAHGVGNSTGK